MIELVEGMAGPEDLDSLLFAAVSDEDAEMNMSHIEEDKNYMDEIQEKGLEYDTDDSQGSDIPEEHENGYGHNEYLRRYLLNMKTLTWNRDS